MALITI